MRAHNLTHLSDSALLRELRVLVCRDRETTAALLAHIAEVDERRLYVAAGYASMHAYCVGELRFSEDAAFRRVRAARTARQFPALFQALAEGALHLTAVLMLAPHLTAANHGELRAAAARLGKAELEAYLAQRFGRSEPPGARFTQLAPAPVESGGLAALALSEDGAGAAAEGSGTDGSAADGSGVDGPATDAAVAPHRLAPAPVDGVAPGSRVLLQLTLDEDLQKKLRHAQALLSHVVPSGDVAKVIDRALDALIAQAERRKLGARPRSGVGPRPQPEQPQRQPDSQRQPHSRPEPQPAPADSTSRHIPAVVRRAVWDRDRGRCTFVAANGHRCGARRLLEFDHVVPWARGGQATVDGLRLRCRAHNQYEAERLFGRRFMDEKRRAARSGRTQEVDGPTAGPAGPADPAGPAGPAPSAVNPHGQPAVNPHGRDVIAALRHLGCRAADAKAAAAHAVTLRGATLEESVRAGLRFLAPAAGRSPRLPVHRAGLA